MQEHSEHQQAEEAHEAGDVHSERRAVEAEAQAEDEGEVEPQVEANPQHVYDELGPRQPLRNQPAGQAPHPHVGKCRRDGEQCVAAGHVNSCGIVGHSDGQNLWGRRPQPAKDQGAGRKARQADDEPHAHEVRISGAVGLRSEDGQRAVTAAPEGCAREIDPQSGEGGAVDVESRRAARWALQSTDDSSVLEIQKLAKGSGERIWHRDHQQRSDLGSDCRAFHRRSRRLLHLHANPEPVCPLSLRVGTCSRNLREEQARERHASLVPNRASSERSPLSFLFKRYHTHTARSFHTGPVQYRHGDFLSLHVHMRCPAHI